MTAHLDVIAWGHERARAGPWRGNRQVAYLSPVPDAPIPSADFVRRCLSTLAGRGYREVVTSALSPAESGGFLAAGFEIGERLHLLGHDMRDIPDIAAPDGIAIGRASPADRERVLGVDGAAFRPFWRLDDGGLSEALAATPHTRFRVATEALADRRVAGYAICGRAGRRGYVQRLAVDPDEQRRGIGRALIVDGLRWLRRWRVEKTVVNTQLDNGAALALYRDLGFRPEPLGLTVLTTTLS